MLRWRNLVLLVGVGALFSAAIWHYHRTRGAPAASLRAVEEAYRQAQWQAAAGMARTVLAESPGNPSALRLLARALARQANDAEAESIYRQLGVAQMQAEDLFLLGQRLIRRGETRPGLDALRAARDADPDHAETLDALLTAGAEHESLLEAAELAERLAQQTGWQTRGMLALARIDHALLEPAVAAELLAKAIDRDPDLASAKADGQEVRRLLARCLLESGQAPKARSLMEAALKRGPDPEARWLLSRSLLMEGKADESRAELEASRPYGSQDPLRSEPAQFVGAARCEACHSQEFQSQQNSNHARSISARSGLTALPWPEGALIDGDNPRVSHSVRRAKDTMEVTTSAEDRTFAALIDYALGSNHQGRSFVGKDREGQAWELRISQYPSPPTWSRTSEHPVEPRSPDGYLGRRISDESVRRCVHCHATNFRAVQFPDVRPEASDHGIGCERCHGPGGHHLQAVQAGFPDLAIARPRLASADRVVALCGQCHQSPEPLNPSNPRSIRFQAPSLVKSRCYTESGSLSCVTCHNPHKNASRTPSDYERICLKCHPSAKDLERRADRAGARASVWSPCLTGADHDCLSCHMPRVSNAVARAAFTDHFIRVRKTDRPPG
jgi:tetratricopeptide (TPR) repeat protein